MPNVSKSRIYIDLPRGIRVTRAAFPFIISHQLCTYVGRFKGVCTNLKFIIHDDGWDVISDYSRVTLIHQERFDFFILVAKSIHSARDFIPRYHLYYLYIIKNRITPLGLKINWLLTRVRKLILQRSLLV